MGSSGDTIMRRSQVVRQETVNLPFVGSIPTVAAKLRAGTLMVSGMDVAHLMGVRFLPCPPQSG